MSEWGVSRHSPPPTPETPGFDGGWFIAVVDRDGFVELHGPYWDGECAGEKFAALDAKAHFAELGQRVSVVPVEGITAS